MDRRRIGGFAGAPGSSHGTEQLPRSGCLNNVLYYIDGAADLANEMLMHVATRLE